jgi:hypothetical protein
VRVPIPGGPWARRIGRELVPALPSGEGRRQMTDQGLIVLEPG